MRYLWGDKALSDMNSTEIDNAARTSNLEIRNARDEAEKKRLLRQAQKPTRAARSSPSGAGRKMITKSRSHDPKTVRPPNWILYSDLIAAQLEERWQADKAAIFEIDINGQDPLGDRRQSLCRRDRHLVLDRLDEYDAEEQEVGLLRARSAVKRSAADAGDIELGEIGSSKS